MNKLIMKFGGATIGTTAALTQALSIMLHENERWDYLILVVSALEGVTDALIEAAHLAQLDNQRGYRRIVATLRTRHLSLIEQLPLGTVERTTLQADVDSLLFDMLDTCQSIAGKSTDKLKSTEVESIIGVGERMAARIVAMLLRKNDLLSVAIDSTDIIITDNVYGNAAPNLPLTRARIQQRLQPMLEGNIIPVITGFIGATAGGNATTLGRGGSDYTASILGMCMEADEVWLWTDVDGMMSTDPREFPDTQVIDWLSYEEAAELAYFGARILHPRMVAPLQESRIPARIRNVFKPQESGTHISEPTAGWVNGLKAVTTTQAVGLHADHNGSLGTVAALVDDLLFRATGTRTDIMLVSQSSTHTLVSFVIPTPAGPDAVHNLNSTLEEKLSQDEQYSSWRVHPVTVITAIGTHLDSDHLLVSQIYAVLDGIKILAVGQAKHNLSIVVTPHMAAEALKRIHALIVNNA